MKISLQSCNSTVTKANNTNHKKYYILTKSCGITHKCQDEKIRRITLYCLFNKRTLM